MMPTHAAATTLDLEAMRAVQRLGTPLFCYSLKTLRDQVARLRGAVSGYPVQLLFATMANDRGEILRAVAGEGVGACVNSLPHLQRALEHGFPAHRIQFASRWARPRRRWGRRPRPR
jgi:diaminopimelate decarboxylase